MSQGLRHPLRDAHHVAGPDDQQLVARAQRRAEPVAGLFQRGRESRYRHALRRLTAEDGIEILGTPACARCLGGGIDRQQYHIVHPREGRRKGFGQGARAGIAVRLEERDAALCRLETGEGD